jgi:hypothetical protein
MAFILNQFRNRFSIRSARLRKKYYPQIKEKDAIYNFESQAPQPQYMQAMA